MQTKSRATDALTSQHNACRQVAQSIHQAALDGDVSRILSELASGVSVDLRMQDDTTPLQSAAGVGHLGALKTLLDKGANVKAVNVLQQSSLHIAAELGHSAVRPKAPSLFS